MVKEIKKRILSAGMAGLMMFGMTGLVAPTQVNAESNDGIALLASGPAFSVTTDKEEYKPGDEITFTYSISGVEGNYKSFRVQFYAIENLTIQSCEFNDAYSEFGSKKSNLLYDEPYYPSANVVIENSGTGSVVTDHNGEVFKLKFKINDDVEAGEYSIKTKYSQYNSYIKDESNSFIALNATEAKYTVTAGSAAPAASSYAASVTADKSEYTFGDTITVKAALTPAQSADLASGSVKLSYDKEAVEFTGAEVSQAISASGRATAEDGVAAVSFTTADNASISVEKNKALELATFKFTAKTAGEADFAITEAVAGEAVDGAVKNAETTFSKTPVTVTVENVKAVCSDYGSDYKIIKYVSDTLPSEGKVFSIGGTALSYYVPAYSAEGKYVFTALVTEAPADLTVTEAEGSYTTIRATGDSNCDEKTNINDAQVVIYMVANKIKSSSEGYDWMNSDVNGDGVINALDAQAIQYYVHYGEFGQFDKAA